ncbi:MAG: tetratricopeptide repeat protein [Archangium sp.]
MILSGLVLTMALHVSPEVAQVDAFRDQLRDGKKPDATKLLKSLSEAARSDKATADTLVSLGRLQLYTGDPSAAALTLDEATTRFPNDVEAHFFRGVAAQDLDTLDIAKKHFERVTVLAPKDPRGWLEYGDTLSRLRQDAAAVDPLKKAVALDPKNPRANALAGAALMAMKRGDEGVKLLDEAVKLEPRELFAAYNAGQYYQLNGKPKLALERFNHVAKADPDDWHVRAKLVQVNQELGDAKARDAARSEVFALRKAGKTPPKMPEFCREQFTVGTQRVMAYESFELIDPRAVRYTFKVLKPNDESNIERVISLGSYETTTNYMRESGSLKAGERAWHLDGYRPDNSHETFGIFTKEPSYDETRAQVVQALSGKLKASSSTTKK